MYIGLHVKYPLFLSDFKETNFLDGVSKNTQMQDVMIIRRLGAELFHAEEQTDMTKLASLFAILRTRLENLNYFSTQH